MVVKPKKTFDELARDNARLEKRLSRESATPRASSGIKGRSMPKPAPVEVEIPEDVQED